MLFLVDEEELVLVDIERGSLALKLEDHHTVVMTSSEQVDLRVSSDHPESIILALEALNRCALVQIPYTDSLVLADRENQILVWVEQSSRGVLEVTSAGVHLPRLGLAHPPKLDQSIVTS